MAMCSPQGWVQSYGSRYVRPPLIFGDVEFRKPMTVREYVVAQQLTARPVKGMLTGEGPGATLVVVWGAGGWWCGVVVCEGGASSGVVRHRQLGRENQHRLGRRAASQASNPCSALGTWASAVCMSACGICCC